ncbi:MAG: tetratricopeptide repeat protein [Helicobacteraceae bacterium]|jgi:tetratricopeptide (TPR) repeat protein|nr:tetratricopeptide repeat protein [Helicobacteraceae bacterium]
MDAKFITIIEQLVSEHGKEALIEATKYKAHIYKADIDDYLQSEFAKEQRLLTLAIAADVGRAIANPNDLPARKKKESAFLKNEYALDENDAVEIVDLLAFVLRGDKSRSIIEALRNRPQPDSFTIADQQSQNNQQAYNQNVYDQSTIAPQNNNGAVKLILAAIACAGIGFAIWFVYDQNAAQRAFELGVAAQQRKDDQEAIKYFTKAIKSNPEYAEAYSRRSASYAKLGDYKTATKDARKACELGACKLLEELEKETLIHD